MLARREEVLVVGGDRDRVGVVRHHIRHRRGDHRLAARQVLWRFGGADVARVMACGADFSFLGRTFMYGVSALGKKGGHHTVSMLKTQLTQVMEQLSCAQINELQSKRIQKND